MENRRRSKRLAKGEGARGGAKGVRNKRTPKGKARDSVGGVLGLTPRHPKGRNLTMMKAAEAAAAAVVKLDSLEVVKRSARLRRTSEKSEHEGLDVKRLSYTPVGRDSIIVMYFMTNDEYDVDDNDDDDISDMSPLDGDTDDDMG